jgi:signal transduction histidine kinase
MTTETEQRTAEMLDESQVQVHGNNDRGGVWRLKETCVRATRMITLSLRIEELARECIWRGWLSTSVVHDLRNPVATIYAAAEMLMDPHPAPTQVSRLAANIYRAAARMRELLADLNSVACENRPTVEMCDIREVIAGASEAASAALENQAFRCCSKCRGE